MSDPAIMPLRLSMATQARLEAHDWPGNIRELESVVEGATALAGTPEIRLEHLPEYLRTDGHRLHGFREYVGGLGPDQPKDLKGLKAAFERDAVLYFLVEAGGNRTRAAREAGLKRSSFQRAVARHGLQDFPHRLEEDEASEPREPEGRPRPKGSRGGRGGA